MRGLRHTPKSSKGTSFRKSMRPSSNTPYTLIFLEGIRTRPYHVLRNIAELFAPNTRGSLLMSTREGLGLCKRMSLEDFN